MDDEVDVRDVEAAGSLYFCFRGGKKGGGPRVSFPSFLPCIVIVPSSSRFFFFKKKTELTTSVATSAENLPSLKCFSTVSRAFCAMSPWSASQGTVSARAAATSSASRLVCVKTIPLPLPVPPEDPAQ